MDDEWILKDEGGARFSLRSYEITINESTGALSQLITQPKIPEDLPRLWVVWHEIHHWVAQSTSSFGLLMNTLHQVKSGVCYMLLHLIQSRTAIQKPAIRQCQMFDEDSEQGFLIKHALEAYLSARKLIDVLWGLGECTLSQCQALLSKVLPFFYYMSELQNYSGRQLNESDIQDILDKFKRWRAAEHEDQDDVEVEQFMFFCKSLRNKLLNPIRSDQPISPQIRFHEKLTWATLLEGWAKYFQHSHVAVMNALYGSYEIPQDMRWETWDSVYVRPLRTMFEILYPEGNSRKYDMNDLVTFMAIADLAANPSLDPKWIFPDALNRTMYDFLPGHRFIRACQEARNLKIISIDNLTPDLLEVEYKRLVSDLCIRLGWEPPWMQAHRWLDFYQQPLEFFGLHPFLLGCKLRVENPLFYGVPHLNIDLKTGESWSHFVRRLPVPFFSAKDSSNIFYLSMPPLSISGQWYVLAISVLLDQIMLNDGPIDWSVIELKFEQDSLREGIKRNMSLHGIDIDKINYSKDTSVREAL